MSDVTQNQSARPTSPHLQVYRLPLTALLSITHRATGAALVVGTLFVAAFLIAAACGEGPYDMVMYLAGTYMGKIVLLLWSAALYFHMCNGIRHLIWDTGACLEKGPAMRTNYIVLLAAFVLTASTWTCAYLF